jgi:serine O-acetyltransferase
MKVNLNNSLVKFLLRRLQHYNHDKYWKMRSVVVNPDFKKHKVKKFLYLYKIKKMDSFNNSSTGTDLGGGAFFANTPTLPH